MIIPTARRLEGIGEYYFSKKLDEVRKLNSQGQNIINLGIGSPDLAPSEKTIEATIKALNDPRNHGYAAYRSSPELRRAMAEWYLRIYQVKLNPDSEILPLLGSKEGILYISLAFVNPGDKVLIPNPGYPAYSSVTRLIGAEPEYYDLVDENDWFPDFKSLEKKNLTNCKMMWVNYPHMPTGKRASRKVFDNLVDFAKTHKILICHDNPYGLVLNDEAPLSIFSADPLKETCLELNSFSKAFNMAGWRVGLMAASPQVVDAVLQVKSNVDSGMFTAVQKGAIEALNNSDQWHQERNQVYRQRRQVVEKIFNCLGFTFDLKQVGLFLWARAPESIVDLQKFLDEILYEAHVFLVPGFIFGSNGSRYARSSLCADVAVLEEALRRISVWASAKKAKP